MILKRITVEISSPYITPLKGDTIWGHVACGVANHEGEEGIEAFINGKERFVTSSAFPHLMLPKPLLPPDKARPAISTLDEYTRAKKEKKCKYVPSSMFLDEAEFLEKEYGFVETSTPHVSISRTTGSAIDGALFSSIESWPDGKTALMDIYVDTTLPSSRVIELLKWAFEFGYGADASTGKGKIDVIEDSIRDVENNRKSSSRYMALGPFVEDKRLDDLRAGTFLRRGKIGGILASSLSPYKKPVILYDEGSTFLSDEEISSVGKILHKMHFTDEYDIAESAMAPVIGV